MQYQRFGSSTEEDEDEEKDVGKLSDSINNDKNYILIVDDDFDITTIIKTSLKKSNVFNENVFVFTDPFLALHHFKQNSEKYDIVLTDIRMPGMTGFEFIEKVKEIKQEVKVLFMSAFEIDDIEFSKVLPSIMIDGFIRKPFSTNELIKLLKKHLTTMELV